MALPQRKIFEIDEKTKTMLTKISSLFGVKYDIVRECWEYTTFVMLLSMVEDDNVTLRIPFIGDMTLVNTGTIQEKGQMVPDYEITMELCDNFKHLAQKVIHGCYAELSQYVQKKFIEPVVNNITGSI